MTTTPLPTRVGTVIEVVTVDGEDYELEQFVRVADEDGGEEAHWLSLHDRIVWALDEVERWTLVSVPIVGVDVNAEVLVSTLTQPSDKLEAYAVQLLAIVEGRRQVQAEAVRQV